MSVLKNTKPLSKSLMGRVAALSLAIGGGLLLSLPSQAGVFNLPRFVPVNEFAIGIEPEVLLTSGSGVGVNLKYTHGISDFNNLQVILGTGGGPRQLRAGGAFTFDFFPDIDKQPGIGVAAQALFVQYPATSGLEVTGIPYVHKSFKTQHGDFDPFLAIPIGLSLSSGSYQTLSTIALGTLFKHNEHLQSVFEFGIGLNTANTYFSGGLVYYH